MSNGASVPQAAGSVVEADLTHLGKTGRRVLLRRPYPGMPWISSQDVCDRAWWHDEDLQNIVVIHDPTARAVQ